MNKTAMNVRDGFLYSVFSTTADIFVFGHDLKYSLNCGVASFVGALAYLSVKDFLYSIDCKNARTIREAANKRATLCDESSGDKYINERTEESN